MALDINFMARNDSIPEDFRDYADARFEKIENLTSDAQRLEVKLEQQTSHTGPTGNFTVELTLHSPKDVVRAEASDNQREVAFDHAFARLQERLRRLRERRKSGHRRASVRQLTQDFQPVESDTSLVDQVLKAQKREEEEARAQRELEQNGDVPVTIRQKVFASEEMTLDEAIDNMELVGHDFYLFVDSESGRPSVAYRRRGWSYGVISLGDEEAAAESSEQERAYRNNHA